MSQQLHCMRCGSGMLIVELREDAALRDVTWQCPFCRVRILQTDPNETLEAEQFINPGSVIYRTFL